MERKQAEEHERASSKRSLLNSFRFWHNAFKVENENLYGPLNSENKEFRVLDVEPGTGKDVVRCTLRLTSLNATEFPSYETISYCWGDPTKLKSVHINGAKARVPRSSAQALQRMRLTSKSRTLWIDAICIDQSNLDERSEQVSLMKEIYNKSNGNLVYLGEVDKWTGLAIGSIYLIAEEIKQEFSDLEEFKKAVLPNVRRAPAFSQTGYRSSLDVEALTSFFSRPYFRRIWVLPETLVAPSSLCHCGTYKLPLIAILRAAVWLQYKASSLLVSADISFYSVALFQWWRCLEWKGSERQSIFIKCPCDLHQFSHGREAGDPRDRIFALTGLLGGEIPKVFVPNYKLPVKEALRNASRTFFVHNRLLSCYMLCQAQHSDPDELRSGALPSWIPTAPVASDTGSISDLFRAHGGTSSWPQLSEEQHRAYWNPPHPDELVVPGFSAERIKQCTSKLGRLRSPSKLIDWLLEVEGLTGITLSGSLVPERTSLLATLILGMNWLGNLARQQDVLEGYSFYSLLQRERSFSPTSFLQSPAAFRYANGLFRACSGRLFFVTSSGRFGLGPPLTKPGDIVAILYGGEVPFVLRSIGDGIYKFVGQCYVEGIMFGEALRAHEAAGGTDESIRIR